MELGCNTVGVSPSAAEIEAESWAENCEGCMKPPSSGFLPGVRLT